MCRIGTRRRTANFSSSWVYSAAESAGMESRAGTEPGACKPPLGELPPVPLPIHLHLSWQRPALHPSLGALLSPIGSRAHLPSSFRDGKAETLKWSSRIQFSLVNWASACTRLRGGERLTPCPAVPPGLRRRLLMMFFLPGCRNPLRGAGRELGLPWGERFRAERRWYISLTGNTAPRAGGSGRPRGDAHHPRATDHRFRGTQPVLPGQNSHLCFVAAKTHPRPTTGYRNATPSRADRNPSLLAQVEGSVMGVSRIAKHPRIPKGLFPNPCKGKPKA